MLHPNHSTQVYRHEVKYFISKRDSVLLSRALSTIMTPDPHTQSKGYYWIRSLYFDTQSNYDYTSKMVGYLERKKIRLRLYDPAQSSIKLEIKNKYNQYMQKESCSISRQDAYSLAQSNFSLLSTYPDLPAQKFYTLTHTYLYRPTILIDYERTAFLYPFQNIRVTLDQNIRAALPPNNFLNPNIQMTPLFTTPTTVLEIKYNNILPDFLQHFLATLATEKSSVSKYCLCRERLNY